MEPPTVGGFFMCWVWPNTEKPPVIGMSNYWGGS